MALHETNTAQAGESGESSEAAFADMALRGGAMLQLNHEGGGGPTRFMVRYIGVIAGVSFLTTLPRRDDGVVWVPPGSQVTFRVLSGTDAYAFTTTALRAHTRPSPYAHFVIPETVRRRPVRRDLRVETRLPVAVEWGDGGRSPAVMLDLSRQGAILELGGLVATPGDAVRVELPLALPELSRTLHLPAVVRNCSGHAESAEQGSFRYGIEFDPLPEQEAILLHYYIDHLIAEQHARF